MYNKLKNNNDFLEKKRIKLIKCILELCDSFLII